MSQHPGHNISTIPSLCGTTQNTCNIKLILDNGRDFALAVTLLLVKLVEAFYLIIKEMAYVLKYRDCVRKVDGILAYFKQVVEDLLDVCKVEVACHHEAP